VYFERARRIIYEIESAKESVLELTRSLHGTLKVHMTPGTGLVFAMPAILAFMEAYPSLTVEISIRPEAVDILRMGFDVSIRSGALDEDDFNLASIDAHQLSKAQYAIVASRRYIDLKGRPEHPEELINHNCLVSARQHSPNKWWFWQNHKKFAVNVNGTLFADNWSVIYDAARAGLGVARLLQTYPVQRNFDDLEILFPNWTIPDRVIWAMTPHMRPMPKKISVFLDFMRAAFSQDAAFLPPG
jgi:DNA-binding transcriptional LysR family regulator